uniref:ALMS motif domain-containing protein n=1 Tax=Globisporangium ultimum (strain ATCC 200006 / CBS 805.95 / DAOM BR144) TaxID=431595 RepID=K3XAV7_GLOUD
MAGDASMAALYVRNRRARHRSSSKYGEIPLSAGEIEYLTRKDEAARRRQRLLEVRHEEKRVAQLVTQRYRDNLRRLHATKLRATHQEYQRHQEILLSELHSKYQYSLQNVGAAQRQARAKMAESVVTAQLEQRKWEFNEAHVIKPRSGEASRLRDEEHALSLTRRLEVEANLQRLKEMSMKQRAQASIRARREQELQIELAKRQEEAVRYRCETAKEEVFTMPRSRANDVDAYQFTRLHCPPTPSHEPYATTNALASRPEVKIIRHNRTHPSATNGIDEAERFREEMDRKREQDRATREQNTEKAGQRGNLALEYVQSKQEGDKAMEWLHQIDKAQRYGYAVEYAHQIHRQHDDDNSNNTQQRDQAVEATFKQIFGAIDDLLELSTHSVRTEDVMPSIRVAVSPMHRPSELGVHENSASSRSKNEHERSFWSSQSAYSQDESFVSNPIEDDTYLKKQKMANELPDEFEKQRRKNTDAKIRGQVPLRSGEFYQEATVPSGRNRKVSSGKMENLGSEEASEGTSSHRQQHVSKGNTRDCDESHRANGRSAVSQDQFAVVKASEQLSEHGVHDSIHEENSIEDLPELSEAQEAGFVALQPRRESLEDLESGLQQVLDFRQKQQNDRAQESFARISRDKAASRRSTSDARHTKTHSGQLQEETSRTLLTSDNLGRPASPQSEKSSVISSGQSSSSHSERQSIVSIESSHARSDRQSPKYLSSGSSQLSHSIVSSAGSSRLPQSFAPAATAVRGDQHSSRWKTAVDSQGILDEDKKDVHQVEEGSEADIVQTVGMRALRESPRLRPKHFPTQRKRDEDANRNRPTGTELPPPHQDELDMSQSRQRQEAEQPFSTGNVISERASQHKDSGPSTTPIRRPTSELEANPRLSFSVASDSSRSDAQSSQRHEAEHLFAAENVITEHISNETNSAAGDAAPIQKSISELRLDPRFNDSVSSDSSRSDISSREDGPQSVQYPGIASHSIVESQAESDHDADSFDDSVSVASGDFTGNRGYLYLQQIQQRLQHFSGRESSSSSVAQYSLPLSDSLSFINESFNSDRLPGYGDDSFIHKLVPMFPVPSGLVRQHSEESGVEPPDQYDVQLADPVLSKMLGDSAYAADSSHSPHTDQQGTNGMDQFEGHDDHLTEGKSSFRRQSSRQKAESADPGVYRSRSNDMPPGASDAEEEDILQSRRSPSAANENEWQQKHGVEWEEEETKFDGETENEGMLQHSLLSDSGISGISSVGFSVQLNLAAGIPRRRDSSISSSAASENWSASEREFVSDAAIQFADSARSSRRSDYDDRQFMHEEEEEKMERSQAGSEQSPERRSLSGSSMSVDARFNYLISMTEAAGKSLPLHIRLPAMMFGHNKDMSEPPRPIRWASSSSSSASSGSIRKVGGNESLRSRTSSQPPRESGASPDQDDQKDEHDLEHNEANVTRKLSLSSSSSESVDQSRERYEVQSDHGSAVSSNASHRNSESEASSRHAWEEEENDEKHFESFRQGLIEGAMGMFPPPPFGGKLDMSRPPPPLMVHRSGHSSRSDSSASGSSRHPHRSPTRHRTSGSDREEQKDEESEDGSVHSDASMSMSSSTYANARPRTKKNAESLYISIDDGSGHEGESKEGSSEPISLADAFRRRHPRFHRRAEEHHDQLKKKREELRALQKQQNKENDNKKPDASSVSSQSNAPKRRDPGMPGREVMDLTEDQQHLLDRLAFGERAKVSSQEMKERTKRLYQKLPEVVERKRQEEILRRRKQRLAELREQEKARRLQQKQRREQQQQQQRQ